MESIDHLLIINNAYYVLTVYVFYVHYVFIVGQV